ncbi:MAG: DUF5684 domain-containing protein [Clostridiales bacterium]|nr:DUF5684 domain-containing protein [Clostridiales bacterium]
MEQGLIILAAGALAVCAAIYILLIIAWWKVFSKAGVPGLLSLIPIVNFFAYVRVATGSAWKTLFFLIPVFGFVYYNILPFKLSRSFGKGFGFGLGLLFLPNVFMFILGFGSAEYVRR